ncbi:major facilitator superfamily domain-containing protein [Aspergillus pseudotamarii]|uniref:Major facilitator superfamily domain-containing protein n=1 Tax=Aspergillus pseudotamarii TaxID=132259 RepID=A0A5N6T433_ASPPS|nr:major facilitator superfamily domain-containing protein [Aspergillus pseudotamarii]KAE8141019.1 major facilitator superfamily domain-containing protein [Aspergillus pseudotamarii]
MDASRSINEKQETLVDHELYSPTKVTYPEGGCDAWLVVLGAWCGLTASLGIYNTAVGPIFDAMGPRALIIAGTVSPIGIFALGVCTEYYQIFLWSIRILVSVLLMLCAISVTFCRSRVPPRKGAETTWRDTLPDPRFFMDGTGVMAVTNAGLVLTDLAYFIPITYTPSYSIDWQHLPQEEALTGSAAFAYQLLAILNVASCVGRYVAGYLADRLGRYNTMIVSLSLCTVFVLCFWLPDIVISDLDNAALFIVCIILFGFCSGSSTSLTPICLGQLCDTHDYGRYYASCFTVVSFGVLASIPIAGILGAALFAGLSYVASLLCFLWVRIKVKGWDWRVNW